MGPLRPLDGGLYFFRRVAWGLSALWMAVYIGSREEATQSIAFKALTELTASASINSLLSPYAKDEMQAVWMGIAPWIHTLFNLPLRCLDSLEGPLLTKVALAARFIRCLPLELCITGPIVIFVHEMGHAQMGRLMFQGCLSRVRLTYGSGGHFLSTPVEEAPLSSVGAVVGRRGAKIAYFAGGPIAQMIWSTLCLKVAFTFWNRMPELGRVLLLSAVYSYGELFAYAHTGLSSNFVGHDFADLRKVGIHPVASMAVIALSAALSLWSAR